MKPAELKKRKTQLLALRDRLTGTIHTVPASGAWAVGFTPPGIDCQPWRKRMINGERSHSWRINLSVSNGSLPSSCKPDLPEWLFNTMD